MKNTKDLITYTGVYQLKGEDKFPKNTWKSIPTFHSFIYIFRLQIVKMLYLRRLYSIDTEYISNQYMHVLVKYEMTANKCSIFLTIALLYLYTSKITPEKIIDNSLKRIIFCLTFICKGLNLYVSSSSLMLDKLQNQLGRRKKIYLSEGSMEDLV